MLRVVVAVTLAAALLGTSMPAVETARVEHADARVEGELAGLAATAERLLARNDPSPPGVPGARRTVTLHAPGPSWASASLDTLSIPGSTTPGDDSTRVSWRTVGGRETTRTLSSPLVGHGDGLTIEGGGSRRLVLQVMRQNGDPVVVVRRPEFKSDAGSSPGHEVAGDRTP